MDASSEYARSSNLSSVCKIPTVPIIVWTFPMWKWWGHKVQHFHTLHEPIEKWHTSTDRYEASTDTFVDQLEERDCQVWTNWKRQKLKPPPSFACSGDDVSRRCRKQRWSLRKMAYQTIRQEYLQIPVVTRAYTTACVLTTAAVVSKSDEYWDFIRYLPSMASS